MQDQKSHKLNPLKATDSSSASRGFTLIELVVVMAILAILISIIAIAINPAEQIAKARDTKRVADLNSMNTAWGLYIASTIATPVDLANHPSYTCKDEGGPTYFMARDTTTSTPDGFTGVSTSTSQTAGSGWAPARIDQTPGGADLALLPADPAGMETTDEFWYAYACRQSTKKYEFTVRLESDFYQNELKSDQKDGGNSTSTYEIGTDLTIIPNGF